MLTISNLTKRYANSTVNAVDGISLELKSGEIFGFLGPNGAGKSTTIKCIVGILSVTEGDISICGESMRTSPLLAKKHIGYVPDQHTVYDKLTGIEYINFMADMYEVSASEREARLPYLADKFNMTDALSRPIKTYSHGMKQKISVICALMHDPDLWILDEPLTGLDPQASFELKSMMREHADKGKTVFFSSHVLEVVEKVCDRVAIIDHGKIIAVVDVKELSREGNTLESYFLDLTGEKSTSSEV